MANFKTLEVGAVLQEIGRARPRRIRVLEVSTTHARVEVLEGPEAPGEIRLYIPPLADEARWKLERPTTEVRGDEILRPEHLPDENR